MKFGLLIFASPYSSDASSRAWRFASSAIDAGHDVPRIFFMHEGIYAGNMQATPAQDEVNQLQLWQTLQKRAGTELVLCVASAMRRGVLDETEAKRYDKPAANIAEGFELGGLGLLVDAATEFDRLLTFA